MNDMKIDLSPRYYIAEVGVWSLGTILVIIRFVGIAPSPTLPWLNITIESEIYFPRIVAALLAAAAVYLIVEWKQSSRKARKSYWAQIRVCVTLLWSCTAFWLSYLLIAANTRFAGISPAWYFGFIAIGFLLSFFVSILLSSSLMIRSKAEAKAINLPRVPVATYVVYRVFGPIAALFLITYYVLLNFSPQVIKGMGFLLVGVPYLIMIGDEFISLFFHRDKNGNRVPYKKRIAELRTSDDYLDYAYFLNYWGNKVVKKMGIPTKVSSHEIQKVMQERFSGEPSIESVLFRVQQQEETQIEFYQKDGDPDNNSPENIGIRILKHQGKEGILRVRVIFEDSEKKPQEVEIPLSIVKEHAEEYLSIHKADNDLKLRKFISYAINQTVKKILIEQGGPLLQRAAEAGQEDRVEELLKQGIDVNEQAEFGWTALLYASAQGYPRIVRQLLDAAANPDIGNVHGITPLMYGARYGNIEVCRLLLECGANPNLQDVYGMTSLMIATIGGHADIVEMLLGAGANAAIEDRNAMIALDFAHKYKQGKIAKKLRTVKSIQ